MINIIFYWRPYNESNFDKGLNPVEFIRSIGMVVNKCVSFGAADYSDMYVTGDINLLKPYSSFIKIV